MHLERFFDNRVMTLLGDAAELPYSLVIIKVPQCLH